jgi:hypothetical protein
MRKIQLTHITSPGHTDLYLDKKKYSVYLGNGKLIHIGSERNSLAFLNEVNRFLNLELVELNEIFIEVHSEFRRSWIYLDPSQENWYKLAEQKARRAVSSIPELFDKCVRSVGSGAMHQVWSSLNTISLMMIDICEILHDLYEKRSQYYQMRRAQTLNARITSVIERLSEFEGSSIYSQRANKIIKNVQCLR